MQSLEVGNTNTFIKRDNNFFNNGLINLSNPYMNLQMVIRQHTQFGRIPGKNVWAIEHTNIFKKYTKRKGAITPSKISKSN